MGRPVEKPKKTFEQMRTDRNLPTSSSIYSFSNPPNQDWNKSPCFSEAKRMNHAASGSFLGTFYHEAEEHGMSFPGPGTYELNKSTMLSKETSCTRPSTLSRRSRTSCASMSNSLMTASLAGADQLLLPPGPDFQAPPLSDFDRATQNKDLLTASFASQSVRFRDPTKVNSATEVRKFERKVQRRPHTSIHYPAVRTIPWRPGVPHNVDHKMDIGLNDSRSDSMIENEDYFNHVDFNHYDSFQLSNSGIMKNNQNKNNNDVFGEKTKPRRGSKQQLAVSALKESPNPESMGAAMSTFSFSEKMQDLSIGYVPVDPKTFQNTLIQSAPGRERLLVVQDRQGDVDAVKNLEEFKPPNTTALRFY